MRRKAIGGKDGERGVTPSSVWFVGGMTPDVARIRLIKVLRPVDGLDGEVTFAVGISTETATTPTARGIGVHAGRDLVYL